jgi:FixJ family two-component response regulator
MGDEPTVFVVDPDARTRGAISSLAAAMYWQCRPYASSEEFLREYTASRPSCAVFEVRIPRISGLELQERLASGQPRLPVIFLTACGTVSIAVRAMRAGAVHFLEKPLRESELWDAIREALQLDRERRLEWAEHEKVQKRLDQLTPRERGELRMIGEGQTKEAIAEALGVCVRTAEIHRVQIMRKLGLEAPEQLMHFAVIANNGHSRPVIGRLDK